MRNGCKAEASTMVPQLNETKEPVITHFMDLALQALREEDVMIGRAPDRKDENKKIGLHLAHAEECYGHLIRRAMVLNGYPYRFRYESSFFPPSRKLCDLVLLPDQSDDGPQWGIEMKWVSNKGCFAAARNDAKKLAESGFERKFLLLFPMTDWSPENPATDLTSSLLENFDKSAPWVDIFSMIERRFSMISGPKPGDFILLLLELRSNF